MPLYVQHPGSAACWLLANLPTKSHIAAINVRISPRCLRFRVLQVFQFLHTFKLDTISFS